MATVSETTGTYLRNLFDPQVIADLIDNKFVDNIVFSSLARVENTLQGNAGSKVTLPYYEFIGTAENVLEGHDIPISQLTQRTKEVEIKKFAKAVQLTDEAVLSAYGDPLVEAASQLVIAIADAVDRALLAALEENTAEEQNYVGASDGLVPSDIPLALAKYGEDSDGTKVLLVNPNFYAKLIREDWIPASEIAADVRVRGAIGMAYGCQVIVTNRLINNGSIYIVKPGTLALFMKRDTMIETDRDILNHSTVIAGSKICAPYLINPSGMVKLSAASA